MTARRTIVSTQPRNKNTGTPGNPGKYDTFKKKTSSKSHEALDTD